MNEPPKLENEIKIYDNYLLKCIKYGIINKFWVEQRK